MVQRAQPNSAGRRPFKPPKEWGMPPIPPSFIGASSDERQPVANYEQSLAYQYDATNPGQGLMSDSEISSLSNWADRAERGDEPPNRPSAERAKHRARRQAQEGDGGDEIDQQSGREQESGQPQRMSDEARKAIKDAAGDDEHLYRRMLKNAGSALREGEVTNERVIEEARRVENDRTEKEDGRTQNENDRRDNPPPDEPPEGGGEPVTRQWFLTDGIAAMQERLVVA